MERFRADGHLSDQALEAMVREEPMDELARLELAEHLAFCDDCLQRYTDLLAGGALLAPARSCRESLWRRIRLRTLRLFTSRYATAAAALVLALTMLWSGIGLSARRPQEQDFFQQAGATVARHVRSFPERWNDAMGGLFDGVTGLFDSIGGEAPRTTQGGT